VTTPAEKGNALEKAVASIEGYILSTTPGLSEKTFRIETNKMINAGGVHHEIDIFVAIDLGNGYNSVFIFECKNWQEAVGKNEVVLLSEKIVVTKAQHGYLIGKSFTKDAYFQAEKDPRLTLHIAAEHDPLTAERPFGFHMNFQDLEHVEISLHGRGSRGEPVEIDVDTCRAKFLGNPIDLRQDTLDWGNQTARQDARSFRSERAPEGQYHRTARSKREFALGEFIADEVDIERAELSVHYTVRVERPAIISSFEVKSRGRVVEFAPVQFRDTVTFQTKLISRE
jgi:hypothetical protein